MRGSVKTRIVRVGLAVAFVGTVFALFVPYGLLASDAMVANSSTSAPLKRVDDGALGWLRVPDLPAAIRSMRKSRFASMLGLFASSTDLKALEQSPQGTTLAVLYAAPSATGGAGRRNRHAGAPPRSSDWLFAVEAGNNSAEAMATLRRRIAAPSAPGVAPAGAASGVTEAVRVAGLPAFARSDAGSLVVASQAKRVDAYYSGSTHPLSKTPAALGLDPSHMVQGWFDVQELYGRLARGPNAAGIVGKVARLGLLKFEGVRAEVEAPRDGKIRGALHAVLPGDPFGPLAALGEPHVPMSFAKPPADLLAAVRLSIKPEAALAALNRIISHETPLKYALWQTQLANIEHVAGKRLAIDALGQASRLWTLWYLRASNHSPPQWVFDAEVADGLALMGLFRAAVTSLRSLDPNLSVAWRRIAKQQAMSLKVGNVRLIFLFTKNRVWVAVDESTLKKVLRRPRIFASHNGSSGGANQVRPGLISAFSHDRLLMPTLLGPAWASSVKKMARTEWVMRRVGDGYRAEFVTQ